MLDRDGVERVWHASLHRSAIQLLERNQSGAKFGNRTAQFFLDRVANILRRFAGGPANDGLIEATTIPPIWIFPSQVTGDLVPAHSFGFANAVGAHCEALFEIATS